MKVLDTIVFLLPITSAQIIFPGELIRPLPSMIPSTTSVSDAAFPHSTTSTSDLTSTFLTSILAIPSTPSASPTLLHLEPISPIIPGSVPTRSALTPSPVASIPSTTLTSSILLTLIEPEPSSSLLSQVFSTDPPITPNPIIITQTLPSSSSFLTTPVASEPGSQLVTSVSLTSSTFSVAPTPVALIPGFSSLASETSNSPVNSEPELPLEPEQDDSKRITLTSSTFTSTTPTVTTTSSATSVNSSVAQTPTTPEVPTTLPQVGIIQGVEDQMLHTEDEQNYNVSSGTNPSCFTPLGENGTCRSLRDCSGYLALSGHLSDPVVTSFLKSRICRLKQRTILFCCPLIPILPIGFQ